MRWWLVALSLVSFTAVAQPRQHWTVLLDGTEFRNDAALNQHFIKGYPWGTDHNGTAKMVPEFAHTDGHGTLVLHAQRITSDEGVSSKPPHLPIHYHAGTVYWKEQVTVDDHAPQWVLEGDFSVPGGPGSWPAFWITAVNGWPPEIDILEFKGDAVNWQNTLKGHNAKEAQFISHKTEVKYPSKFHHYKAVLTKASETDVRVQYFVDGSAIAEDIAKDYVGKPMWLIVNLQMEGSSTGVPPAECDYRARNLVVKKLAQ